MLPELLDQIPPDQHIGSVTADGAYDTRNCHDAIAERQASAVIPPRKNAKPWKPTTAGAISRNEAVNASRYLGRAIWRRWSGYHRRSRVERKMQCVKLMGQSLMAVRHRPRTDGGSTPHLRPAGRGNPSPHCGAQPLHRAWHTPDCPHRVSPSGGKGKTTLQPICTTKPRIVTDEEDYRGNCRLPRKSSR